MFHVRGNGNVAHSTFAPSKFQPHARSEIAPTLYVYSFWFFILFYKEGLDNEAKGEDEDERSSETFAVFSSLFLARCI